MLALKAFAPLGLVALSLVPAQERVKTQAVTSFEETLTAVSKAWEEGRYGAASSGLKTMMNHVSVKRTEALHAALPAAPAGWEKLPCTARQDMEKAGANPMAAMGMNLGLGQMSEFRYKKTEGRGEMKVTVTADSPMIGMMSMMFTNPAALNEKQELIKYGSHMAILETKQKGERYGLQLLVENKHMVEIDLRGGNDEFLLSLINQATVDALQAELAK